MNSSYDLNPTPRLSSVSLTPLFGIWGLFFVATIMVVSLVLLGWLEDWAYVLAFISGGLWAIFSLVMVITWLVGRVTAGKLKEFVASSRPLLRWTHDLEEWRQVIEVDWQENKGYWKVQLGCLTFIFGLTGLLTGGMIGFDEGLVEAVAGGMIGALAGAMVGATIGAVVAGGNYLATRRAYTQTDPGQVILGPDEIFANGDYFRADGDERRLLSANFDPDDPATLVIMTQAPTLRGRLVEQEWRIFIPHRLHEEVEAVLPRLRIGETDNQPESL
jgi:hypothetical protein